MFTINKVNQICEIILNEYPSLKNENIKFIKGNEFSVEIGLFESVVTIADKVKDNIFSKYIREYLLTKNFDTNYYVFNGLYEVFSLIHEIGHIYYKEYAQESSEHYQEYKNKSHNSYKNAFYEYRNIPYEKLADKFAINIIRNNVIDIWSIMNDISIEKAQEEYDFWNMWV